MAAFFCSQGIIQHVHCVTYELTVTPDKLAVGQSLTITAKVTISIHFLNIKDEI
jgi:hypothetical protein